jgi:hypothetical protein
VVDLGGLEQLRLRPDLEPGPSRQPLRPLEHGFHFLRIVGEDHVLDVGERALAEIGLGEIGNRGAIGLGASTSASAAS